jgi:hypothetical protein
LQRSDAGWLPAALSLRIRELKLKPAHIERMVFPLLVGLRADEHDDEPRIDLDTTNQLILFDF